MSHDEKLFAGESGFLGGLSNEGELFRLCPDEFKKQRNEWTRAASNIFFSGADMSKWAWRSSDPETRKRQLDCFRGLISGSA